MEFKAMNPLSVVLPPPPPLLSLGVHARASTYPVHSYVYTIQYPKRTKAIVLFFIFDL